MKKPELLCPAKGLEELKTAVAFGADAVYIGGEAFSLRAKARNFSTDEMAEAIRFAHEHGVRVHVTANIFAHEADIDEAYEYFKSLKELKPDAMIIADPGMFTIAGEVCPEIERHISTQANNTNHLTYRFWKEMGAKRVVAARELSLAEIKEIRSKLDDGPEIECFVHGAMCISYSGRCLLSAYMTGREANRGECTHPCRWSYTLHEKSPAGYEGDQDLTGVENEPALALEEVSRPGEYMPVFENERGTYIMNSKDLCMIEHIPELCDAGIDSLKIEGRMKNSLYVAVVARTYRKALDDFAESPDKYRDNLPWYREEIKKCTTRDFTTGFYFGKPDDTAQIYDSNTYNTGYTCLGSVEEVMDDGSFIISQKNKFSLGEEVEIMRPDGRDDTCKVLSITDQETGAAQESAPHPGQRIRVKLEKTPETYDILRRKE